jgi:hypothetical protein
MKILENLEAGPYFKLELGGGKRRIHRTNIELL